MGAGMENGNDNLQKSLLFIALFTGEKFTELGKPVHKYSIVVEFFPASHNWCLPTQNSISTDPFRDLL